MSQTDKPCPLCGSLAAKPMLDGLTHCSNPSCILSNIPFSLEDWARFPRPSEGAEALTDDEIQTLRHAANGLLNWGNIRYITIIEDLHAIIARLK